MLLKAAWSGPFGRRPSLIRVKMFSPCTAIQ